MCIVSVSMNHNEGFSSGLYGHLIHPTGEIIKAHPRHTEQSPGRGATLEGDVGNAVGGGGAVGDVTPLPRLSCLRGVPSMLLSCASVPLSFCRQW